MNFAKTLANLLITERNKDARHDVPNMDNMSHDYDIVTSFELGTGDEGQSLRTRQDIYRRWQLMQKDPQIAEGLSLHVTAALGGHESTGDVIFITPHERVRGRGIRAKELRQKVESAARHMTPILNRHAFSLARQAIAYGDSYARIYSDERTGVIDLMNNERTHPPLIQSFVRGEQNVGFFVLEMENWERVVARLTPMQMLRVKMPRIEYVPQMPLTAFKEGAKLIHLDEIGELPVLPDMVGGSFLYPIESVWQDLVISMSGLNNQQIADSVKQAFLTVNMDGMPPDQRKRYTKGLTQVLQNYRDRIKEAFNGGEALYGTAYHVLPTWGDKQSITPVGDLSQRTAPLSSDTLMINLRRIAGGLGLDLSLMGWADMLTGGLGDGAAFHTSAQIMRRSMLIRMALTNAFNDLMALHFGLVYGEYFHQGDYPWQFDFYSDQSAAATEALSNKQARMNMVIMKAQALQSLRELGLSEENLQAILEDDGGMDYDIAVRLSSNLGASEKDGTPPANEPIDEMADDVGDDEFDDEI
ncbi:MAG: hypothetical protein Q4B81_00105 [Moraxella sp.]|nr:hypothetical protein [Moraxella sp.]